MADPGDYVPSMAAVMAAMRSFDAAEHTEHATYPASWVATFREVLVSARKAEAGESRG